MKLELTLDKDRTIPVSEMRRVLALVLSRLRGETEVTKLSFAITITPPQDTGDK